MIGPSYSPYIVHGEEEGQKKETTSLLPESNQWPADYSIENIYSQPLCIETELFLLPIELRKETQFTDVMILFIKGGLLSVNIVLARRLGFVCCVPTNTIRISD